MTPGFELVRITKHNKDSGHNREEVIREGCTAKGHPRTLRKTRYIRYICDLLRNSQKKTATNPLHVADNPLHSWRQQCDLASIMRAWPAMLGF